MDRLTGHLLAARDGDDAALRRRSERSAGGAALPPHAGGSSGARGRRAGHFRPRVPGAAPLPRRCQRAHVAPRDARPRAGGRHHAAGASVQRRPAQVASRGRGDTGGRRRPGRRARGPRRPRRRARARAARSVRADADRRGARYLEAAEIWRAGRYHAAWCRAGAASRASSSRCTRRAPHDAARPAPPSRSSHCSPPSSSASRRPRARTARADRRQATTTASSTACSPSSRASPRRSRPTVSESSSV